MVRKGIIYGAGLVALAGALVLSLSPRTRDPIYIEDRTPVFLSDEEPRRDRIISPILTTPYSEPAIERPQEGREVKVPLLEKFTSEYVPSSWTDDRFSFNNTAIEQLVGCVGVYGAIKFFEELPRDGFKKEEDWKVWSSKDGGTYKYKFADGRHQLEVSGKDGFRLGYQVMSDGNNKVGLFIGEKWGMKDGKVYAWQHMVRPDFINNVGSISLQASTYDRTQFFGHPLWKSYDSQTERIPTTSSEVIGVLRNRKLDDLFKDLK